MARITRRALIVGSAAGALLRLTPARAAAAPADFVMRGDAVGADVWFDPVGLRVEPGATVTWQNEDPVNAHTATAYHPANRGHPLRIPAGATPWDSGYLLLGDRFSVTLTVPGVYDFFCRPHEMAGMVGRIVVAEAGAPPPAAPGNDDAVMSAARGGFPTVAAILAARAVHRRRPA
jgi:plastocyanin